MVQNIVKNRVEYKTLNLSYNVVKQRDFAAVERSGADAKIPTELALLCGFCDQTFKLIKNH